MRLILMSMSMSMFLFFAVASTASASIHKVGTVDMQRVMQTVSKDFKLQRRLPGKFEGTDNKKLVESRKKLRGLIDQLSTDVTKMAPKDRKELENRIRIESETIRAFQKETRAKYETEKNAMQTNVEKAIKEIAKKENLDLVLKSNSVAFAENKIDITDQVIAILEKTTK